MPATLVDTSRKTKVPKAGPNIVYKRSYNKFCSESYVVDVKNICWSMVCNGEQHLTHLVLIPVTNKHAPIKKNDCKNLNHVDR